MTNGFYSLERFSFDEKLNILTDAIFLSYMAEIQEKYTERYPNTRGTTTDSSIADFIISIPKEGSTLHVIDRSIYNQGAIPDSDGEVCFHYSWKFLYCHLSLENLGKLVEKYNLELQEF